MCTAAAVSLSTALRVVFVAVAVMAIDPHSTEPSNRVPFATPEYLSAITAYLTRPTPT